MDLMNVDEAWEWATPLVEGFDPIADDLHAQTPETLATILDSNREWTSRHGDCHLTLTQRLIQVEWQIDATRGDTTVATVEGVRAAVTRAFRSTKFAVPGAAEDRPDALPEARIEAEIRGCLDFYGAWNSSGPAWDITARYTN
ncbi:hypothetical protein EEJ42_12215 [Streptomyces botrytidirepellens]|uniref:Uncharacterized protein n=1 Tax=Streptomyces botrytidirepellens TaxID=2486417 RepID=A0A3M8WK28_9ACTN|nr:hypothetical protein EEJ42_12215 [Streptomyces botrytidirepellens]